MRVVVPGSFDPFTLGHLDVVSRAVGLFGDVIVAVGVNAAKDHLLSFDERLALAQQSVGGLTGATAEPMGGLLIDFCREREVGTIIRGARSGADFEAEMGQAQMHAALVGLEWVILPATPAWGFVSSTLVRQLARGGGDIGPFVTPAVADYWRRSGDVHRHAD